MVDLLLSVTATEARDPRPVVFLWEAQHDSPTTRPTPRGIGGCFGDYPFRTAPHHAPCSLRQHPVGSIPRTFTRGPRASSGNP